MNVFLANQVCGTSIHLRLCFFFFFFLESCFGENHYHFPSMKREWFLVNVYNLHKMVEKTRNQLIIHYGLTGLLDLLLPNFQHQWVLQGIFGDLMSRHMKGLDTRKRKVGDGSSLHDLVFINREESEIIVGKYGKEGAG